MSLSESAKAIADKHRNELGFVLKPALLASEQANELEAVFLDDKKAIGFCHFHHCKNKAKRGQTTIYSLAV
ncbi:MAG: hypothetical protein F6J93_37635, partial [Oscillatoria sp. SIO1A7]|nr:hypothetical protein [Oscillatoria sp. SIO1A7]